MKKIIVLLVLALGLIGCGSKQTDNPITVDPVDYTALYNETLASFNEATSFDYTMTMNMTSDDESADGSIKIHVVVEDEGTDQVKAAIDADMSGTSVAAYYVDGYMYTSLSGYNLKQTADAGELASFTEFKTMFDSMTAILSELDAKTENGDFVYSISATDPADFAKFSEAFASLGEDPDDMSAITSIEMKIVIGADKVFKSLDLAVAMDDQSMTGTITVALLVHAIGADVTPISFPDFSDFADYSE